jgi:RHS repeat-associated protein
MTRWLLAAIAVTLCVHPRSAFAQEQVLYYHTDAIGSVRMITDANGQVVERHDYLPFGEEYPLSQQQPSVEKRLFGGKEHDQETGFEYSGARYYASGTGRFTTVDPGHVGGDIFDPQSWNGYAYARNNPLAFIDPFGLDCVYVNSSEDGVRSIDHDGNAGDCGRNRGTWVPGTVSEGNAVYNPTTGLFQVASTDGNTVYYATFGAGAQTNESGKCVAGCKGADIQHANAAWLGSMAETQGASLEGMVTFMVTRQEPLHGGIFNKIASGPLAFWNNHWAGPGGMGPPHGRGDWAAMAHDYAFSLNEVGIRAYFDPSLSPEKAAALIRANRMLIGNAGGMQAGKMGAVFGVVNAFQWYRNTWR